jgi:hypothetical protein
MKKVVIGVMLGAMGVFAWQRATQPAPAAQGKKTMVVEMVEYDVEPTQQPREEGVFKCDGRQYCSQMTSCAEAEYFLENCPDVKMDGEGDGAPCAEQWCGDR